MENMGQDPTTSVPRFVRHYSKSAVVPSRAEDIKYSQYGHRSSVFCLCVCVCEIHRNR